MTLAIRTVSVTMSWVLFLTACSTSGLRGTAPNPAFTIVAPATQGSVISDAPMWPSGVVKILGELEFGSVVFDGPTSAWVGGERASLFRSFDGGKTWQKKTLGIFSDARVIGIAFPTTLDGWIAVSRRASILNSDESVGWLLYTRDGGQSWVEQYRGHAIDFSGIYFQNDLEGWAVGRKLSSTDSSEKLLVLHTQNGGKNWDDVSRQLPSNGGYATDVVATSEANVFIVTIAGKLFSTADSGKSWRSIASLEGDQSQTAMLKLRRTPKGQLAVLGGARSREGTWLRLVTGDEKNGWKAYEAAGVYATDFLLLQGDGIFACGSQVVASVGGGSAEGVIMYSDNRGLTWTVVYRNKEIERINALALVSPNKLFAVGDKGLLINVDIPPKPKR